MRYYHEPSLRKYMGVSLLVHVLLVVILVATPALGPSKKPFKREKIVWVRIPKGLDDKIGVGLKKAKGMPKTTIAESKKPIEVPPPSKEKKEMTYKEVPKELPPMGPTKPVVKKKKVKKKRKPKYKSATEKALARISESAKTKVPEAAQLPDELEEGGVPFGSETGPFVSPDDPIYVLYQAKIRKQIMDAWVLPLTFVGRDIPYSCQITVKINTTGKVVRAEFEERSGHDAFDQSAFRAIFKASPLDIPPEKLKREAFGDGFLIEFDPEVKM
jgi:TonB family protein